eukprot:7022695-Pyramimonas_sp.AAC.1
MYLLDRAYGGCDARACTRGSQAAPGGVAPAGSVAWQPAGAASQVDELVRRAYGHAQAGHWEQALATAQVGRAPRTLNECY